MTRPTVLEYDLKIFYLLETAGDHVCADAEDDGHGVDGDGEHERPHARAALLQADGHPLEQAVHRQGHHHHHAASNK